MSPDDVSVHATPLSAEALRAEMERTRAELVVHASTLRQEVSRRTDWREWVRRRPLLSVGMALAVGFLLGERR